MKLMDFQEATVNRILDLFDKNQNRVLLADEVGLGKTIVANGVVTRLSKKYRSEGKSFKVVYVCSNLNIAAQNCRKLGIPEEDCLNFNESRLSMQHLRLREIGERHRQLIPMTPATSFSIKSGQGIIEERALIYVMLEQHLIYRKYKSRLISLLSFETKKWDEKINCMRNRVKDVSKVDKKYLSEIIKSFDKCLKEDKKLKKDLEHLCTKKIDPENEYNRLRLSVIKGLRKVFAQISLKSLHPDLVIMDEFQRFKDLLDTDSGEESEQKLLSKQFLKVENTKVLLMSATPYKPFSTLEEFSRGEEDHYSEFKRVINFLCDNESKKEQFEKIWRNYSQHLKDLRSENLIPLIRVKEEAEDAMYQVMCRTERRNDSIIDTDKAKEVHEVSIGDVKSFIDMQHLVDALKFEKNKTKSLVEMDKIKFPVEYVKSAPYLMSFMKYKIWEKIVNCVKKNPDVRALKGESLFLRRDAIKEYRQIPCNNAKLNTLFGEVFGEGKNGAECLLWIPASKPYYDASKTGVGKIYAKNVGYSKVLVFSRWEMVPRVIAGLTSFEAERLVHKRLFGKEKDSYFVEVDDNRLRRKGSHQRISNDLGNLELCITPCKKLAELYNPIEYMGQPIANIREEIKKKVRFLLMAISDEGYTKKISKSADNIVALLKKLDGNNDTFEGIPPGVEELLTDLSIGAPANCALRILGNDENVFEDAKDIARSFVTLFNKPESAAILRTLYKKHGFYYEQVMRYCVEGNLQAVMDEYAFVLSESGKQLVKSIKNGFVNTASIQIDTKETVKGQPNKGIPLRTHFAVGYYNAKISEDALQRTENIRRAFNSPFRPFVLATTSIGQEGLDFHYYARKIMHWNLPSNQIDLEQREGRINRYMCHAIRQNLAESEYGSTGFDRSMPVWDTILNNALKLKGNYSDLIPYWRLPDDFQYTRKIERIVPLYPFSKDTAIYERLIEILAIYRLTLGQPRQEELIDSIKNENLNLEDLEKLCIELSPWLREEKRMQN